MIFLDAETCNGFVSKFTTVSKDDGAILRDTDNNAGLHL